MTSIFYTAFTTVKIKRLPEANKDSIFGFINGSVESS